MSELTLTVLRLGFLVLLWTFVLIVAGVMRSDLFGPRVTGGRAKPAAKAKPVATKPAKAPKQNRKGAPRTLTVVEGSLAGTAVTLGTTPITIGRSPGCTLVIDDDYASNQHARLSPQPNGWVIEDLGSTNGTYLQSTRVAGIMSVPAGAPIRIGKTVLELRK